MSKGLSNLLTLLVGIALLAVAAYWFVNMQKQGKSWWGGRSTAADATSASGEDAVADASSGEPGSGSSQSIDRISAGTVTKPGHFLHKKIAVESYKTIEFDLPGQMRHTELEGSYLCVTKKGVRDESGAAVELSLMNADEYSKFSADQGTSSTASQRPASHADIDWDLRDTYGNTQKYYLVFRNASRRPGAAIVEADFAVKQNSDSD